MKMHFFAKTLEDNRGDLLGTIDATQTGLKDWEILERLGVDPASLKVEWCGDYGKHLAVREVDCIVEIEMEVS